MSVTQIIYFIDESRICLTFNNQLQSVLGMWYNLLKLLDLVPALSMKIKAKASNLHYRPFVPFFAQYVYKYIKEI